MRHCLDFLTVAAAGVRQPGVAAALLSREAAAAVLVVAGKAAEPRTQATALRTLYCLCRAGGCGLTWQQLAAGAASGPTEHAELLAGGGSIAAAVFAVVGAAGSAAAKNGSAANVLAAELYGLAAVGALLAAAEARSPDAGAALAAALHAEQLAPAQEAVAAACTTLGRSPQLLALLDQQQQGAEVACEAIDFHIELDASS